GINEIAPAGLAARIPSADSGQLGLENQQQLSLRDTRGSRKESKSDLAVLGRALRAQFGYSRAHATSRALVITLFGIFGERSDRTVFGSGDRWNRSSRVHGGAGGLAAGQRRLGRGKFFANLCFQHSLRELSVHLELTEKEQGSQS